MIEVRIDNIEVELELYNAYTRQIQVEIYGDDISYSGEVSGEVDIVEEVQADQITVNRHGVLDLFNTLSEDDKDYVREELREAVEISDPLEYHLQALADAGITASMLLRAIADQLDNPDVLVLEYKEDV